MKEKKRAGCFCIMENTSILIKMVMHWKAMKRNMTMFHWLQGLNMMNWSCRRRSQSRKRKVFSYLLELTTAIDKYNLPIDQIYIKEDGNALLISDKITVDLYNKKDIDIKISELAGMLKKVKGKGGTIDMKYFSEDHKIAVFQPKKS